jgi:hypothetical protein
MVRGEENYFICIRVRLTFEFLLNLPVAGTVQLREVETKQQA